MPARLNLRHSKFLVPCLIFVLLLTTGCAQQSETPRYLAFVGDAEYNPSLDDAGFKVCNVEQVQQYYAFGKGMQFKGEKIKIIEYFEGKFKGDQFKGENGYITIRFIVNCEGNTGRFRVQEMDFDFQPKHFSKGLSEQLLILTQNLNGWVVGTWDGQPFDYYQHLIFKIEDGKIIEILP
jgi:hypothetical protein